VEFEEKAVDESRQLNIYHLFWQLSVSAQGIPKVKSSLKIASQAMVH